MNEDKHKQEILTYIDDNYNKIHKLAVSFVGNYNADDLINESIITIIKRKAPLSDIRNKFVFLFVVLKNNAFYKYSAYNKLIESTKNHSEITESDVYNYEQDNHNNIKYDIFKKLIEIADVMFENKEITWYQHKLFNLFYNYEELHDIKDLTNKEINKKRKMSYRRLGDEVGIDFQSIRNSLIPVINKIKTKLKDDNLDYSLLYDKFEQTN